MRYTSRDVLEPVLEANAAYLPAWPDIIKGSFVDESGVAHDAKFIADADNAVTYLDLAADGTLNVPGKGRLAYSYDMVKIPQNDLPIINVSMESISLTAKPRRIAVYYSQISSFIAKTDYGFDMDRELQAKAVAELAFEIDEEIIHFLANMGRKTGNQIPGAVFNKRKPIGISLKDHYESFAAVVETAKKEIYKRTQKFMPSFMLASADLLPILALISSYKPVNVNGVTGPFLAGTLNGLKVFVSPSLKDGEWFLGIKGQDLQTAAAVYAPLID